MTLSAPFPQLEKKHDEGQLTAYIKGAPERVLAKCTTFLKDGVAHPITDEFRELYDGAYNVCSPPSKEKIVSLY